MGTTLSTSNTGVSNRKGRPNYALAYKRQVAIAACEPDISVAKLAQSHGLNANMVFKWRRQYRAGLLDGHGDEQTVLMPVALPSDLSTEVRAQRAPAMPAAELGRNSALASGIEIELNGARVRVTGTVDPIQLRLVLRCLMPV
ncbi:transposase [Pandoraea sp.]|uniref:IS66-like element accessory protein TnpA n=1 Tax=Pandoraea sp. TaxID=1883445 RepID=UPI0025E10E5D|nr:transposase [Pandoraea sp.]